MGRLSSLPSRLSSPPSRLGGQVGGVANRSKSRDQSQPWRAWYKTARWQRLRLTILERDGYQCQQTGVMLIGTHPEPNSPVVDHIIPHRGSSDLFWDVDNLQAVSKAYHDSEKQAIEARGRF